MGRQSSRIYFKGNDHKEIYYQGKYHKAMYIGSELVWEKNRGEDAFRCICIKTPERYLEYSGDIVLQSDKMPNGNYLLTITGDLKSISLRETNLLEVLTPLPKSMSNTTSLDKVCGGSNRQVNSFTSIPENFLWNCKKAQSIKNGFSMSELTAVPDALFRKCPELEDFSSVFARCKLTRIPARLFETCKRAKCFSGAFSGNGIVEIPGNLFDTCSEAVIFDYAFKGNLTLGEIPAGLFKNCTKAESFIGTFANTGFAASPPIFNNTGIVIPGGLFAGLSKAKTFNRVFGEGYLYEGVKNIPGDTFAGCLSAVDFTSVFSAARVDSIPEGVFKDCVSAEEMGWAFWGCQNLRTVPEGIFASCSYLKNVQAIFAACESLEVVPDGTFSQSPEINNFKDAFSGCTDLVSAPKLWLTHPGANGSGCYRYCTRLPFYDEIPSNWK